MLPKHVIVFNPSVQIDVGRAIENILPALLVHNKFSAIGGAGRNCDDSLGGIGLHDSVSELYSLSRALEVKVVGLVDRQRGTEDRNGYMPGRSLTDIRNMEAYGPFLTIGRKIDQLGIRFHAPKINPCSLLDLKVSSQVAPLLIANRRINHGSSYSDKFGEFEPVGPFHHPYYYSPDAAAPWDGILAAAFGFLCLGWSTFRQGKDWSAMTLLIGVIIFAYGCIVLLPWLADHSF